MALRGASFLAIWNDIDTQALPPVEYDKWLTHEHMAERVGVPGFLRGRRYIANDGAPQGTPHAYFICYETRNAEVMTSPPYLERLNNPTPFTQRVMPALTNFLRMGCRTAGSAGAQVGGALATLRFRAPAEQVSQAAQALCDELVRDTVVVGAHVGMPEAAVAAAPTRERELRPVIAQEGSEEHVLLVESANGEALRQRLADIEKALRRHVAGASEVQVRTYGLSYLIEAAAG